MSTYIYLIIFDLLYILLFWCVACERTMVFFPYGLWQEGGLIEATNFSEKRHFFSHGACIEVGRDQPEISESDQESETWNNMKEYERIWKNPCWVLYVLVHPSFIMFHHVSSLLQDCFRILWGYPDGAGEFGQVWINSSVVEEAKATGAVSSSGADKSTEELQTCRSYAELKDVVVHLWYFMIMYDM